MYKFVAVSQKYLEWPSLAYHNRIKKKVRSGLEAKKLVKMGRLLLDCVMKNASL